MAIVLVSVNVNAQDLAYNSEKNRMDLYANNDLLFPNSKKITYDFEDNVFQSRGWQIAGADAAGALGGVGSVAGIASWFSWTPAAPVAVIAVGVGAIIGGVGTSLAVGKMAGETPNNPKDLNLNEISFSNNYFDNVGVLHNQILFDYYSQNSTYSPESYYDFLNKNKSEYGIKELYISYDYIQEQYNTFKNLRSVLAP